MWCYIDISVSNATLVPTHINDVCSIKGVFICWPRNPTAPSVWQSVSREMIAALQPANRKILLTYQAPITQIFSEHLRKSREHFFSNFDPNYGQCCPNHDSWAVATWVDLIIIFCRNPTRMYQRIRWWSHKPFRKWIPACMPLKQTHNTLQAPVTMICNSQSASNLYITLGLTW